MVGFLFMTKYCFPIWYTASVTICIGLVTQEVYHLPKAFSDKEREALYQKFLDIGEECWGKYGVKRTNVEEVARLAGVAKGTFYLFFQNKEQLFHDVLKRGQAKINEMLNHVTDTTSYDDRDRFIRAIDTLFHEIKNYEWLNRLLCEDGDYSFLFDSTCETAAGSSNSAYDLMGLFSMPATVTPFAFAACIRSLFFLLLHEKEIGETEANEAFSLLLEGLTIRIYDYGQRMTLKDNA